MIHRLAPIDIEGAVASVIESVTGVTACAPPLPPDFADALPHVLVTRTGGNNRQRVVDTHTVSIDVRADTWEQAMEAADGIAAFLRVMHDGSTLYDVPVYSASVGIPYTNSDPAHPTVPRVSISATITTRSADIIVPL